LRYDGTNCKATKEKGCFGKIIGWNIGSITKPSTKTIVGATLKAHERKGIWAHNLWWISNQKKDSNLD
jgi:hypothetical protein